MTLGITGAFRWAGTIVSPPKHGHTCAVALDVEVNCHSLADAFASGWRRGYSSPSSLVTLAPAGGAGDRALLVCWWWQQVAFDAFFARWTSFSRAVVM